VQIGNFDLRGKNEKITDNEQRRHYVQQNITKASQREGVAPVGKKNGINKARYG
jgi:cell division protein FtsL